MVAQTDTTPAPISRCLHILHVAPTTSLLRILPTLTASRPGQWEFQKAPLKMSPTAISASANAFSTMRQDSATAAPTLRGKESRTANKVRRVSCRVVIRDVSRVLTRLDGPFETVRDTPRPIQYIYLVCSQTEGVPTAAEYCYCYCYCFSARFCSAASSLSLFSSTLAMLALSSSLHLHWLVKSLSMRSASLTSATIQRVTPGLSDDGVV